MVEVTIYRALRAVISFALHLFYRVEVMRHATDTSGAVLFVGNHPNSLIDPALMLSSVNRQVTFLAREPLFRAPVLGWLLKKVGALPVYRRQDHPGLMEKNEGTLDAAGQALKQGKAISIFPEGKSHSEPQLAEIKTGAARIVLRAARDATAVRIIPVGLTYAQKHRFRSRVRVEIGHPLLVAQVEGDESEWVATLTDRIDGALRSVTLSLAEWDDLELITTVDELYVLRTGAHHGDPRRLRALAKGASILRAEQPARFDDLKVRVLAFRRRLAMVQAEVADVRLQYRKREVFIFALRQLLALVLGLPLASLGLALFVGPYMLVRGLAAVLPLAKDRIATFKLVAALVVVPLCWVALTVVGWSFWGIGGLVLSLVGALPLAFFTRRFVERWRAVMGDVQVFVALGNRSRLKAELLRQGELLQDEVLALARELSPKL